MAGDVQAWTKDALRGRPMPELIEADSSIPYERIAALRPDLILATNTFELEDESAYDLLSRIAPTLHFTESSLSDSWQEVTRRIGAALGREDRYVIRFAEDLGLRLSPRVDALRGAGGRAKISAERYHFLESDVLIGNPPSRQVLGRLERDELFTRVDVVRDRRYVGLPIGAATSMAFPSLLSVRYAIREVVPDLERAVAGKG